MAELFDFMYLIFLQALSLGMSSCGSIITACANMVHVYFIRRAIKHDEKYVKSSKSDLESTPLVYLDKSVN